MDKQQKQKQHTSSLNKENEQKGANVVGGSKDNKVTCVGYYMLYDIFNLFVSLL